MQNQWLSKCSRLKTKKLSVLQVNRKGLQSTGDFFVHTFPTYKSISLKRLKEKSIRIAEWFLASKESSLICRKRG